MYSFLNNTRVIKLNKRERVVGEYQCYVRMEIFEVWRRIHSKMLYTHSLFNRLGTRVINYRVHHRISCNQLIGGSDLRPATRLLENQYFTKKKVIIFLFHSLHLLQYVFSFVMIANFGTRIKKIYKNSWYLSLLHSWFKMWQYNACSIGIILHIWNREKFWPFPVILKRRGSLL